MQKGSPRSSRSSPRPDRPRIAGPAPARAPFEPHAEAPDKAQLAGVEATVRIEFSRVQGSGVCIGHKGVVRRQPTETDSYWFAALAKYCSSLTFSSQSAVLPSSCS